MKHLRWRIFAGFFSVILNAPGAESNLISIPSASEILARLRKEHPRLLMTTTGVAELKRRVTADPQLKEWQEKLREEARRVMEEPASSYEIPDGRRLLATSRRVLGRIYTLALLYRLDGDERYLERAWKELEAAANFKDWNPNHFLDTAEMTHAFAIGHDWLYDSWNAEQRALLRKAALEKGLTPALEAYRREEPCGSCSARRRSRASIRFWLIMMTGA